MDLLRAKYGVGAIKSMAGIRTILRMEPERIIRPMPIPIVRQFPRTASQIAEMRPPRRLRITIGTHKSVKILIMIFINGSPFRKSITANKIVKTELIAIPQSCDRHQLHQKNPPQEVISYAFLNRSPNPPNQMQMTSSSGTNSSKETSMVALCQKSFVSVTPVTIST